MGRKRFTPEACSQILDELRIGATVDDACDAAGVPRPTYEYWLRKGRLGSEQVKDSEHARFVRAVEAAKAEGQEAPTADEAGPGRLTKEKLIELLERQAGKGNLRAIDLLLRRPWESNEPEQLAFDPFDALDAASVVTLDSRRSQ